MFSFWSYRFTWRGNSLWWICNMTPVLWKNNYFSGYIDGEKLFNSVNYHVREKLYFNKCVFVFKLQRMFPGKPAFNFRKMKSFCSTLRWAPFRHYVPHIFLIMITFIMMGRCWETYCAHSFCYILWQHISRVYHRNCNTNIATCTHVRHYK